MTHIGINQYLTLLGRTPLFYGISPEELSALLGCLGAKITVCRKQDILLLEGTRVTAVGVVLAGRIRVVREDYLGNRDILAELEPGNLFAESYACAKIAKLPVTVMSVTDGEILWIDYGRIVTTCPNSCRFHSRLIQNMLAIIAVKNVALSRKIDHLSRRSTRDKILAYLSDEAVKTGKSEFDIPFDRQEMADYLCVDRSALSAELGRLRREGILDFRRCRFTLHTRPPGRAV